MLQHPLLDGEGRGSKSEKAVINIILVGTYKVYYPNQGNWLARGILAGLAWGFLMLLDVGVALLRDLLPPDPIWFKIHECCNILYCFFTIIYFAFTVHVLEKSGRKNFSFKHASMGLSIFILVVFQVLQAFNRPHITPPPDPKRKDEEMEGKTSNKEPLPSPGNPKIQISWEIIHRLFGPALMTYRYYPQLQ